jgi:hypothetical protein
MSEECSISTLELLRRLPEEIGAGAVLVLDFLHGQNSRSVAAERLVTVWEAAGDEACLEMLQWYAEKVKESLGTPHAMSMTEQHRPPGPPRRK